MSWLLAGAGGEARAAEAPTITCPANITQASDAGLCSAVVTFAPGTTGDPAPGVTCTPASGSSFALGTTTVTCTATNSEGTDQCMFDVTVLDAEPPAITCSTNRTVECAGPGGAAVAFTPLVADACDGSPTLVCSPVSGTLFGLGQTTVNCFAYDAALNTNACSFTITVVDTTAPVLTCSTNRVLECEGSNGAVVAFAIPVLDACDADPVLICSPPSGSEFGLGETTVVCEAYDADLNTNTCSFTVTIQDTTGPVLTCPASLTVECASPAGAMVTYAAGVSDACDASPALICDPASGSVFAPGQVTVVCEAHDANLNTNTCSFTVSVVDTTPPAIVCSGNLTIECTSPGGMTVNFSTTADDGCDAAPVLSCSPASGTLFGPGQTTVMCEAYDSSLNTNSCTFTVDVVDTVAPVISCSANLAVECSGPAGTAVDFVTGVSDACDAAPTLACAPASGTVFAPGQTTVICEAYDSSLNTNTCSFTITIEDTTAPAITCPALLTVECTGTGGANVTFLPVAADDCDANPTVICSPASGALFAMGETTVECEAHDASLNTNSCSFTVEVVDTTAPVVACSADLTVECSNPGGAAVTFPFGATDLCDAAPALSCSPASGTVFGLGQVTVTCEAYDSSLNTNSCTFTVTVVDTTAPTVSCSTNLTVECSGAGGAAVTYATGVADACDPSPTLACVPASGTVFAPGQTMVSCVAYDASLNTNSCSFTVEVVDTTAPVLACSGDLTIECTSPAGATVTYTTGVTDACDPGAALACTPASGTVFGPGETTVVCQAYDSSLNTNSCSFTVEVVDTTAPVLTCSGDLTVECAGASGAVVSYTTGVSDACDPAPALSCSPASGTVFGPGETTVVCQAYDSNLNTNSCSFTVEVVDTTMPAIACSGDLTVECTSPSGAMVAYSASASDLCDASPVLNCSPASGTVFGPGETLVVCQASDSSLNTNSCSFTVTVSDTVAPAITCSTNVTMECTSQAGAVGLFATVATDDCDASPVVNCNPASGSLFGPGQTTVSCHAYDASLNTNSCSFTVTVSDTVAPAITCSTNVTMECTNAAGTRLVFTTLATDDCDPNPSIICSPTSGTPFPVGSTLVRCRAVDASMNTNLCSFTVQVIDTTAPAISCSTNRTAEATGPLGALVSFQTTAIDLCDANVTVNCSPAPGSLFAKGVTTVNCHAYDAGLNTNSCSFTVTVVDTTDPVLTCPGNVLVECISHTGTPVSFVTSATDVCDTNVAIVCVPASGSSFSRGATIVTCTATDDAGNTDMCAFSVSVVDTTPPAITCSTNILLECAGPAGTVANFGATAVDGCDTNLSVTCSPASGTTFVLGVTTVTCRAVDAGMNTNSCNFTVTVVDRTAPVITCPADLTEEAASPAGAAVAFMAAVVDDCDTSPSVTCSPASGGVFALGETVVTCQAVDGSLNTNSCSFTVTVADTTAPDVACSTNLILECTSPDGAVAVFAITAADAADADVAVSCTPASGTLFAAGLTEVVCEAVDDSLNTNSCSFTVEVLDTIAPAIVCSTNLTVECTSPSGRSIGFSTTAVDDCDASPTVVCDPAPGSVFQLGVTTVSCVAFDDHMNTNSCSFTVSLVDTVAPVITCSSNLTRECTGPGGAMVSYSTGVSDLCDNSPALVCAPASGSLFPVGQTVVDCQAHDDSLNTNNCSFTVSVVDTTAPVISCPGNLTLECATRNGTTVNFTTTATDICDTNPVVTCIPAAGTVFGLGLTPVTCRAVDDYQNTNTCSFNVVIVDTIAPQIVCSTNITVEGASPAGANVSFAVTAADICDTNPVVTCTPVSGALFPLGVTTVTCRAFDASENTNSCSFMVMVVDTTGPAITCSTNITVEWAGAGGTAVTFTTVATDQGDGSPMVTCTPASGSFFQLGMTPVSCQAVDASGNTNSCGFIVTVVDTIPPEIVCSTNRVVECSSPAGAGVAYLVSVSDNCDSNVVAVCDPVSGSAFAPGSTTVVCTVADSSGNTNGCAFEVSVLDTVAPEITCAAGLTVEGTGPGGAIAEFEVTAADICDTNVLVLCEPASGSLFVLGMTTVNCRAVDDSQNTNTCSFAVTVVDTTMPEITCASNLTAEAAAPAGTAVSFSVAASDLCDTNPAVVCSPVSGSLFLKGVTVVTCRAFDVSNNTNTCTFAVTIRDTTAPMVTCQQNVVVECDGSEGRPINFTTLVSDNSDSNLTVNCFPASGSVFMMGLTVVTCQAVDSSMNTNACSFTVTLRDTTPPAITCPPGLVVECSGAAGTPVTFAPVAVDLCDPAVVPVCNPPAGSLFGFGVTAVLCRAVDVSRNTNTCSFTVTVVDTTPPVVACSTNITMECAGYEGTAVTFGVGATDNCDGGVGAVCSPAPGSLFGLGVTTVTCVAGDGQANTNSCSFTVTIIDTTAPVVACSTNLTLECDGPAGALVTFGAVVTDNCYSNLVAVCTPASGSIFALGMTEVTCAAGDPSGNTNSCVFSVEVIDTVPPEVTCSSNMVVEASMPSGAVVGFSTLASDLCDENPVLVCAPAAGSVFGKGTTIVSCHAYDTSLNTNTCSFSVTVLDGSAPVIVCSTNRVVEGVDPSGTAVTFVTTATDASDPNVTVICVPGSGSIFQKGTTTVNCHAYDVDLNTNLCSFTVRVIDTTPPDLDCPGNVTVECLSPGGTPVNFVTSATDNCDSNVLITCVPPPGFLYSPGATIVTCTARDDDTNKTTCTFTVTIVDTTAPRLTCSTNMLVECTQPAGAVAVWTTAATDNCDAVLNIICTPASGSLFPPGLTPVLCEATDGNGNRGTCGFNVTVVDRIAPAIVCSTNLTVECVSFAGTPVNWVTMVTDACDTNPVVVCAPVPGSLFGMGTTAVTCRAWDTSLNTNSCSFTVTVVDTTAPAITCSTNLLIESVAPSGTVVSFVTVVTDACDTNPVVVCVPPSGSVFQLGMNPVECRAYDSSGNTNECSFTVTIQDTTAPAIVCADDMVMECVSWEGTVVSWLTGVMDNGDANPAVSCSPASGSRFGLGETMVDCEAVDGSLNTNRCSFRVTILDTTPPSITCSTNMVVECGDPAGTAVGFVTLVTDLCDTNPAVSCVPASGSLFDPGLTEVNCQAVDGSGNTNSCSFTVTVLDTTPPAITCSSNRVMESASPAGTVVAFPSVVADDCDSGVVMSCVPASGSLFGLGLTTVMCQAADVSGNTNSCTFTVTIVDTTAPVIVCSTNRVRECSGTNGTVVAFVTGVSDNGDSNVVAVCVPPPGSLFGLGETPVTCSSVDASGNSNNCSFLVTVVDTVAPFIICASNVTIECLSPAGTAVNYVAFANDVCEGELPTRCIPPAGTLLPRGVTVVTCDAVDGSGNRGACSFLVTLVDTTPPRITCSTNLVRECLSFAGTAVSFATTVTDNSDSNAVITCTPPSGSLFGLGVTAVGCEAVDSSGNSSVCGFTVTMIDTTAPAITCSTNRMLECVGPAGTPVSFVTLASDTCDTNVAVVCIPAPGSAFAVGLTVVSCEAVDASGNRADCTFDVNIVDTTAPMITCSLGVGVECVGPGGTQVTFNYVATDTCETNLAVTCVPASRSLFAVGVTEVTCTAVDGSGNSSACSFDVTVMDTTAPQFNCPAGLIVECTGSGGTPVTWNPGMTDNCDSNAVPVCVPAPGSLFGLGTVLVTCVGADGAMNTNTCTFPVTVLDRTAPTLICPTNVVVECMSPVGATVTYAVGVSDFCDPNVMVTCVPPSGSLFALGQTLIRCTAPDVNGNTNSCLFPVSVVDRTPPVVTCWTNITLECVGPQGTFVTYGASVQDACDLTVTVSCTPSSGRFFTLGNTIVTCTSGDVSGNTNSCSFLVSIVDTVTPTIVCPTNMVLSTAPGEAGALTQFTIQASDTCDTNLSVLCTPPSGIVYPLGQTTVSCVATDDAGNVAGCSFLVTVVSGFVKQKTLGHLRNNFTGFVGYQFVVGSEPLVVTHLGRIVVAGNTMNHTVKIARVSNGTDVPGASVLIATAGRPAGEFTYLALPEPVILETNTAYYLASEEWSGADQWHDIQSTLIPTSAGTINSGVYYGTGFGWSVAGVGNSGFGPSDFRYYPNGASQGLEVTITSPTDGTVLFEPASFDIVASASVTVTNVEFFNGTNRLGGSSTRPFFMTVTNAMAMQFDLRARAQATDGMSVTSPVVRLTVRTNESGVERNFITSKVLGSTRNNFGGFLGMKLTVGPTPVTVTALGRVFIEGNSRNHLLKLVRASTGQDVPGGSTTVAAVGGTPGEFIYSFLELPVMLQANTAYYVLSQETSGGDSWYDLDTAVVSSSIGSVNGGVFVGETFGLTESLVPSHCFIPVDFKYVVGALPPPAVFFNFPTDGSIFLAPTNILLRTDASAGVSRVEFFEGATKLGQATSRPFNFLWINPASAIYDLTAVGTSLGGMMATSGVVQVEVTTNVPPPMVTIIEPVSGSSAITPTNILIRTVTTPGITNVEFYAGLSKLGEDRSGLGQFLWINPQPGNYSLRARAHASSGLSATSSVVVVTINTNVPNVETSFVVSKNLGALMNSFNGFLGMTFTVGPQPITVIRLGRVYAPGNTRTHTVKLVKVSDGQDVPGGSVQVSLPGVSLGEFVYADLAEPVTLAANTIYHLVSSEVAGGDSYHDVSSTGLTVTDVATLDSGVFGGPPWTGGGLPNQSYVPVNFIYLSGGALPPVTVALTSPEEGENFLLPTNVVITVEASAGVTNVEFYAGAALIGADDAPPYSLNWTDQAEGTVSLTARAYAATGMEAVSSPVTVTLTSNVPPAQVALTLPADGAIFVIPATITLGATASLGVTNVDFYAGETFLGNDTVIPYRNVWSSAGEGTYLLSAVAQSVNGMSATSSVVLITVTTNVPVVEKAFIISANPRDPRNDLGGFVGMEITVGNEPITATALGRYKVAGNNRVHQMKVVKWPEATDVPGSMVTVDMTQGNVNEFVYSPLAEPLVFEANALYFIVSAETIGGDTWYDVSRTVLVGEDVASIDAGVYSGTTWTAGGLPNHAFGPVDFKFLSMGGPRPPTVAITSPGNDDSILAPADVPIAVTTGEGVTRVEFFRNGSKVGEDLEEPWMFTLTNPPPGDYQLSARATGQNGLVSTTSPLTVHVVTNLSDVALPFIVGKTLGPLRHNFNGYVGMKITVGPDELTVTALGREYLAGNVEDHILKIVSVDTDTDLPGSVTTVNMTGGNPGQFKYVTLAAPVTLQANTMYYVVSQERVDGDVWCDLQTMVISASVGTVDGGAFSGLAIPWTAAGLPGQSFVPLSFKYKRELPVPEVTLTSPAEGQVIQLPATLVLAATATATVTNVEFFAGSTKLGEDMSPPFSISLSDPPMGNLVLTAKAHDQNGLAGASAPVSILVRTNIPNPTVALTSPGDGQSFIDPATVMLTAVVNPGVTNVQFFDGAVLLGADNTAPYGYTYNAPALGNHGLTARAQSLNGLVATSSVVNILVRTNVPRLEFEFAGVQEFGSVRSDFNGFLGMELTIGPAPVKVISIGRIYAPGNTMPHQVKFVRASDRMDVPGASVTVVMPGTTVNQFKYVDLPAPVMLEANTSYYLVSMETEGGDIWYDVGRTIMTNKPIATIDGGVFDAPPLSTGGLPQRSFVPVNFRYSMGDDPVGPSVSISSPAAGAELETPGVVTINATVSPGVVKVEFYAGTNKLGEDLTAPFSFNWVNPAEGHYILAATATDGEGLMMVSSGVGVDVVVPVPLAVAITAPVSGSSAGTPGTLAVSTVTGGDVVNTEFFNGAAKIGEAAGDSPGFAWINPPVGVRSLTAVVTDDEGARATSAVVTVTVTNVPLTVAIINPVNGQGFGAPADVTIEAMASPQVVSVEFFDGAGSLGVDALPPFSTILPNAALGAHALRARATSGGGLVVTSAVVNITVTNVPPPPPTVAITSPLSGSSAGVPGSLTIDATASAGVTNVEFFAGAVNLGRDTSAPFRYVWMNPPTGAHALTARATNTNGLSTVSAIVNVTVTNVPPSVVITSPVEGARLQEPASVLVEVSVSASVTLVEFFSGAGKIGESLAGPFTLTWNNPPVGDHALTARATATGGGTATSGVVNISVITNTPVPETEFIADQVLTGIRNNFQGNLGMQFTIGSSPVTVTSLGRMMVTNNTASHVVKLVRVSDKVEVPGGAVPVSMAGGTVGQFKFARLAAPVVLAANTSYYLVSAEQAAGDLWYDLDVAVTPTSIGTVQGAVYEGGGFPWTLVAGANRCFVPLSFKYQDDNAPVPPTLSIVSPTNNARFMAPASVVIDVAASEGVARVEFFEGATKLGEDLSSPFSLTWPGVVEGSYVLTAKATGTNGLMTVSGAVTVVVNAPVPTEETGFVISYAPGGLRSDYSGFLGCQLTVGSNPLTVTRLGRLMLPGNVQTHVVKLVDAITRQDVPGGSVMISMAGGTVGQFKYATLAAPVTLSASGIYHLVSSETVGGDVWYDVDTTAVTVRDVAVVNFGVFDSPPWSAGGTPGHSYIPVDFMYLAGSVVTGPNLKARPGRGNLTVAGVAGRTYRIDGSTDLESWVQVGQVTLVTTEINFTDPGSGALPWRFYRAVQVP